MNPFQVLAHKYDIFNAADIPAYVEFIRKAFEKADIDVREVLDVDLVEGLSEHREKLHSANAVLKKKAEENAEYAVRLLDKAKR